MTRKFIVAEGLYANYGDLAPLPQMVSCVCVCVCVCVGGAKSRAVWTVLTVLVAMDTGGSAGPVPGANPVGRVPLLWSAGGDGPGSYRALGRACESAWLV